MKIQCDVCNKDEASVFCTADEAALCDACNHRVHHANKLASKHLRFSLLHPTASDFPICDICKERRAFLFCQQDRAILCRECDIPIHTANDHTLKHNRFLLTGVKLSAASDIPTKQPCVKKPNPGSVSSATAHKTAIGANQLTETSSISEYLIETLPGWRVDDFLDPSSVPLGFSKTLDDGMLRFVDTDFEQSSRSGLWVPESPEAPLYHASHTGWLKETEKKEAIKGSNNNTRWSDDGFTVPQMSPPSIGSNKRCRPFW